MEPTDSRLQASSPQNEDASVVFDMIPLDGRPSAPAAPSDRPAPVSAPADAVAGVESPPETPLSVPEVHQPLGQISRLEAALSQATAPRAPVAPPAASPPPPPPSAPPAPVSPIAPSAADPISTPTIAEPAVLAPSAADPVSTPSITEPAVPAPTPLDAGHDALVVAPADTPAGQQPGIMAAPSGAPAPAPAPMPAPEIRVNTAGVLTLPGQPVRADKPVAVAPNATAVGQPRRLPMLPIRIGAVGGTALALAVSAWQAGRVINGQERLTLLSLLALVLGVAAAVGVVAWTWLVVENARRALSPARTQELPDPTRAATTWVVPLVFIGGASAAITYLSDRMNTPSEGTESSFPLLLALAAIVLALPLMYSPVTYLSGVVRKVGGRGIRFAEWIWVPVVLSAVGAAMIAGLRIGGAFGEDFEGIAPPWVVGVAAIVPATVVVWLGWRAAGAVEGDVGRAFDRRLGLKRARSSGRSRFQFLSADGGPNQSAMHQRGYVNQLPGARVIGIAVGAGLAGLALLSLVASIVVFLFWQEARDGVLLPADSDRAWDLVSLLHSLERNVAFGVLALTAIWSFIAVSNVRLASARRRNPVLAAVAWPLAAAGIWLVGDRLVADGSVVEVLAGFAAQALLLAVPIFLVYRAAGSIGSRRQLLRVAWAFGVVLLVHVQGLGGLSTANATVESTEVARLAGYLALGALLQLLAMFAGAGAMRALTDTTSQVALRHNVLIEQRQATVTDRSGGAPSRRATRPEDAGAEAR